MTLSIITTQSCDVDEAGDSPKKPWVQVAPGYELSNTDDRLALIRRWRVSYLAPVTALGLVR